MDPGLHAKQGINHLNRVLAYARFVEENGEATVHLTYEDWHVLADTLFHMNVPSELIPSEVLEFSLADGRDAIILKTQERLISVEMM